jgi:hypothetical protein
VPGSQRAESGLLTADRFVNDPHRTFLESGTDGI